MYRLLIRFMYRLAIVQTGPRGGKQMVLQMVLRPALTKAKVKTQVPAKILPRSHASPLCRPRIRFNSPKNLPSTLPTQLAHLHLPRSAPSALLARLKFLEAQLLSGIDFQRRDAPCIEFQPLPISPLRSLHGQGGPGT